MGGVKIAHRKEEVNMFSVLLTCKCLVIFLPETSLSFLFVEYCKVF